MWEESATAQSCHHVVGNAGSAVRLGSEEIRLNKVGNFVQLDRLEKKEEWSRDIFLKVGFRRVRFAHTAPPTPRPKMGFAIFRLCPPTTLRVVRTRREVRLKNLRNLTN